MGKTLYLECSSGISGDMTVAALLDLGADREILKKALSSLKVEGFRTEITRVNKSGLDACDFAVILDKEHENYDHDMEYLHGHPGDQKVHAHSCEEGEHVHGHQLEHSHEELHFHTHKEESGHVHRHKHEHRGMPEIKKILLESELTDRAKDIALSVFEILAQAEAKAHGVSREQVHFHEVGAVDSIVDIAAAAVCLDNLDISQVIVPKLCEGNGFVRCQHGVIPVPVPAVVNIVQQNGLQLKITDVEGELVTPTGAAIAAAVRTSDQLPQSFVIENTGLGAGKRKYSCPGILRAMIIREEKHKNPGDFGEKDRIWRLETNIDDCTGEELGNVMQVLFEAGARDVYYTPIYMKKNRPAWELSVISTEELLPVLEAIIFEQTTTIGIRRIQMERTVLQRETLTLQLPEGSAGVKICTLPDGSRRCYPEYSSAVALAAKKHISYREAWQKIRDCWQEER